MSSFSAGQDDFNVTRATHVWIESSSIMQSDSSQIRLEYCNLSASDLENSKL